VVIEAMASGLPVIVTDEGGPQSLIGPNSEGGFVVPITQKEEWKRLMTRLVQDGRLREDKGDEAMHQVERLDIRKSFEYFFAQHHLPEKSSEELAIISS
jgi:glycosyltransferase involved in cell wall biosynthesis